MLQVIGILCVLRRVEAVHFKYETASGLLEFVDLRVPKREERTFLSVLTSSLQMPGCHLAQRENPRFLTFSLGSLFFSTSL